MEINEIHRTWSRISENSEIVANWEDRTERAERALPWVVTAGDIRLYAEPRLQGELWEAVSGVRRERPGTDTGSSKVAELADALVVQIPAALFGFDWKPDSCSK